jgi:hypothetical protein
VNPQALVDNLWKTPGRGVDADFLRDARCGSAFAEVIWNTRHQDNESALEKLHHGCSQDRAHALLRGRWMILSVFYVAPSADCHPPVLNAR